MVTSVRVELGERSYDIAIGSGLLAGLGEACRNVTSGRRVLVVADATVDALYGPAASASLTAAGYEAFRAVVPAGEESKSGERLFELYDQALAHGLDRRACVVALGGGVVGDLAGFMAATYLRGLRFIQVPTTLLAMVDSAVGGKTGINLKQGKNLVGAFHQPSLVVCDTDVLRTLPPREFAAGLAEVIKAGIIQDAGLFAQLEASIAELPRQAALLSSVIARACAIKADVVRLDERDGGLRNILNFGHTLAHALENTAGYGTFLHGEAVGIGLVYAARVSARIHGLPVSEVDRIAGLVQRAGLPVRASGFAWKDLRRAMEVDKKGSDGQPRFVLADRLGHVDWNCIVPDSVLEEVWHASG
jgi:3-dehydroquinate synthase